MSPKVDMYIESTPSIVTDALDKYHVSLQSSRYDVRPEGNGSRVTLQINKARQSPQERVMTAYMGWMYTRGVADCLTSLLSLIKEEVEHTHAPALVRSA